MSWLLYAFILVNTASEPEDTKPAQIFGPSLKGNADVIEVRVCTLGKEGD